MTYLDKDQVLAALDTMETSYSRKSVMVRATLSDVGAALAALPAIPLDHDLISREGYEAVDHEALLSLIDRVEVEYPSDPPLDNNDERNGWHQGIKDLKYALARQNMIDNVIPISAREGVQLRAALPVLETKKETPASEKLGRAVMAIHQQNKHYFCVSCRSEFPCETVKAVREFFASPVLETTKETP